MFDNGKTTDFDNDILHKSKGKKGNRIIFMYMYTFGLVHKKKCNTFSHSHFVIFLYYTGWN